MSVSEPSSKWSDAVRSKPNKIDELIGDRVRLERERLGISAAVLAGRVGLTIEDLDACEQGRRRIGAALLMRIVQALNIPVKALFGDGFSPDRKNFPPGLEETQSFAESAEVVRLFVAFDAIVDSDDRQHLVELAETIARGRLN